MTQTDIELKIMKAEAKFREVDSMLNDIAFLSGLSKSDITSKKKTQELVSCRRIASYFLYEKERLTYRQIARKLHMDHSTIIHHVDLTRNSINQAKPFEKKLYKLISKKYE